MTNPISQELTMTPLRQRMIDDMQLRNLGPPPGFQRIRHFGFLANCHRKEKLALCRALLTAPIPDLLPPPASLQRLVAIAEKPTRRCPECGLGLMVRIQILPAFRWPFTPWDSS